MTGLDENADASHDVIRLAILDALVADLRRGAVGQPETYYRRFAGHERTVDEEYHQLVRPEAPPRPPEVARRHDFAHFSDLCEIGQGGQGIVYRALDTRLQRPVALKLLLGMSRLRGDVLERFLREAEVAARLDHDSICTVYESGTENGVPYIAMQFVPGATLSQWVERWTAEREAQRGAGATPTPHAERQRIQCIARWGVAVADALAYAHAAGVVHRDVKPGNVVIRDDGVPVVLDFGLARRESEDLTLTVSGAILGTPAYLPPEQLSRGGERLADGRADVYSLGVTLYELLTLQRPFDVPRIDEMVRAARAGDYVSVRQLNPLVPRDLAVIVQTAMDAEPDRRYQGAAALARDLRNFLERRPIEARPVARLVQLRRWYQRNPGLAAGGALTVLSLVAGLVVSLGALDVARQRAREFERVAANLKLHQLLADTGPAVWRLDGDGTELRQWLANARGLVAGLDGYRADLEALREGVLGDTAAAEPRPPAGSKWADWVERHSRLQRELAVVDADAPQRAAWQSELERLDEWIAEARAAGAARQRWRFPTQEQQWLHDQIVGLIAAIESMQREVPGQLTIPALSARLELLEDAERLLHGARAPRWQALAARLHGGPPGLRPQPVRDLVPLGPDPISGLEEFALVGTGTIPVRPRPGAPLEIDDDGAVVLVLLPGGETTLGAVGAAEARDNETPWHVHLTPFLIGKHEVTQAQWLHVMGDRPASAPEGYVPRMPIETVTWTRAQEFCDRVGVLLPTESQWEYACRADSSTRFYWGDDATLAAEHANLRDRSSQRPDAVPWDDGAPWTAPVGSYQPNGFGLFDMQGNVHEWCRDLYVKHRMPVLAPGDALTMRLENTYNRVFRGASWYNGLERLRASYRDHTADRTLNQVLGFRVVRPL